MPSKTDYLIAFLSVATLSIGLHVLIFRKLKRLFLRDFAKIGPKLVTMARVAFVYFDLPFAFLFFRKWLEGDLSTLTQILIYPFVVWQFLMAVWAIIIAGQFVVLRASRLARAAMADRQDERELATATLSGERG